MEEKPTQKSNPEDERLLALASYIWIISLIMLLVKKDNPFVIFHARQGFVLFAASVLFSIVPIFVWLNFFILIISIVAMYKAYQGEKWKIPLVGDLAEKVKF